MEQVRPYGGIEARDRVAQRRHQLLDAGLELLGAAGQPAELTVRAVCGQAGLSARYFYESFIGKDQLVVAVFDQVVADLAATTQAAVAAAPRAEQNRAGLANLVRTIAADDRVGRLLFNAAQSNTVLAGKRAELGGVFAQLSGQHVRDSYRVSANESIDAVMHFVVGGVGQTIDAWVAGDLRLDQEQLVNQLVRIVDRLSSLGRTARPAPDE